MNFVGAILPVLSIPHDLNLEMNGLALKAVYKILKLTNLACFITVLTWTMLAKMKQDRVYCMKSVLVLVWHLGWIWGDTPYFSVFSPNNTDKNNSNYFYAVNIAVCWKLNGQRRTKTSKMKKFCESSFHKNSPRQ